MILTSSSSAVAQTAPCLGDCSSNDKVTVDEILTGVNIALNAVQLTTCPVFDGNHDNKVTVDEILTAVNNALHGCTKGTPLPTATATRTPSPTIAIIDFGFIGYVANDGSGTVSVVDPTTGRLTTQIALRGADDTLPSPSDIPTGIALDGLGAFGGVPALGGSGPQGLSKRISLAGRSPAVDSGGLPRAIATDGRFAYVTSQFPDVVSVIDTTRGTVVDTIDGLGLAPEAIALTADGRLALVTNFASASVSVIDTAPTQRRVVSTVPVSAAPNAIAITPNGERAYITHFNRNANGIPTRASVTVIDTMKARNDPTHAVVMTLALGDESEVPTGIAIAPDGTTAYVASFQAGKISVIDISRGNVLGTPFFVFDLLPEDESLPTAIAVNRRGKVYVTNFGSDTVIGMTPSTVSAAQGGAAAAEPPDVIRGAGTFPSSLAITPDGAALFVGSFDPGTRFSSSIPAINGKLAVVDAAHQQVATSIGVDRFPVGVALVPRTTSLLGANETQPVGVAPTPRFNCYSLDCLNPADCIVPLGRHQAKLGGLRSGQGEHRCGGAGPKPTPTPTSIR